MLMRYILTLAMLRQFKYVTTRTSTSKACTCTIILCPKVTCWQIASETFCNDGRSDSDVGMVVATFNVSEQAKPIVDG